MFVCRVTHNIAAAFMPLLLLINFKSDNLLMSFKTPAACQTDRDVPVSAAHPETSLKSTVAREIIPSPDPLCDGFDWTPSHKLVAGDSNSPDKLHIRDLKKKKVVSVTISVQHHLATAVCLSSSAASDPCPPCGFAANLAFSCASVLLEIQRSGPETEKLWCILVDN